MTTDLNAQSETELIASVHAEVKKRYGKESLRELEEVGSTSPPTPDEQSMATAMVCLAAFLRVLNELEDGDARPKAIGDALLTAIPLPASELRKTLDDLFYDEALEAPALRELMRRLEAMVSGMSAQNSARSPKRTVHEQ